MRKLVKKFRNDGYFRATFLMTGSAIFNVAYGVFSIIVGLIDVSPYMVSSGIYYLLLSFIEGLILYRGKKVKTMRPYGFLLMVLDLALSIMTFYTLFTGHMVGHNEIVMITIALYTFIRAYFAIRNLIKARRTEDRQLLVMRVISFSCVMVNMLTLTVSMTTTFGEASSQETTALIAGAGLGIFILNLLMSIYLVINKPHLFQKPQQKAD